MNRANLSISFQLAVIAIALTACSNKAAVEGQIEIADKGDDESLSGFIFSAETNSIYNPEEEDFKKISAETNSKGKAVLSTPIEKRTYEVKVSKKGYFSEHFAVEFPEKGETLVRDAKVIMFKIPKIKGYAYNCDKSKPASGAKLSLNNSKVTAIADEKGNYVISNALQGDTMIIAKHHGSSASIPLNVSRTRGGVVTMEQMNICD